MSNPIPRILVIESDHDVRSQVCTVLETNGYRALVTGNWLDPEDVRQLRPVAMIVEPFVNGAPRGWDYLRMLRTQPGMQHLPVIACTADHEQLRDVTAAELALASAVILKPLNSLELLATLRSATQPRAVLAPLPWPDVHELDVSSGAY